MNSRFISIFILLLASLYWGVASAVTISTRTGATENDAVERNNDTDITGDLRFSSSRLVGVRFDGLTIPQGATIISAYIEVTAERTSGNQTNRIDINGHAIDDAPIFSQAGNNDRNISSRPLTTAGTRWTVQRFVQNRTYQTPDISSIVQEIVNRPGWASGNAMVFVMDAQTGQEKRTYAHDTSSSQAPRLVIEYDDAGPQPGVCSDNVLDNFNAQSFSNDDGTLPWSGPWTEYDNAGAGPLAGKVRITTAGRLRLDNYTGGEWNGNPGVDREVDLSGYKTARLRFDYELLGGVDNADWFRVQVSSDGGATWDRTWDILNQRDGNYTFNEDITSSISANTVVSIRIYDEVNAGTTACCYGGTNERIEIDFVEILAEDICDAIVELQFEELSWNGTPGEVLNEIINGINGTAFGGANTSNAIPPDAAITGDPGTCRFGGFNGSTDYVQVPHNPSLNGDDALAYIAWINPDNWSGVRQIMAKSVHGGGSGRAQMGIFSESGVLKGRAETNGGRYEVTTALPATGVWTHVALIFDGTNLIMYLNGVEANRTSFASTTLIQNSDPLNIGKRVGTAQYFFDGYIDEVRVYDFPVRAQDVPLIMMETHPCPLSPLVAGFNIVFGAGSASTCSPLPVTISAIDSASNIVPGYTGNVLINTLTAHGDWSAGAPDTPVNPVNNGTADDGSATYQFTAADGGSIDLLLTNTHADDLTISVGDAVAGVTSISAPISFRDNAFVITPVTCTDTSCPGTGSQEVVAGRDHVFNVALWRRDASNPDPGCFIATGYDTGINPAYGDLKAWISRDGADPAGLAPSVAGNLLANAAPAANNLDLSFSNGQAQFTLATTDVGKFSINLRDDTSGFAKDDRGTPDTSDDLPLVIDGSGSTLTVRPFALGYTNINKGGTTNPAGTATSGNGFVAAGDTFEATIGGYLWQAADDSNNDGLVDDPATIDVTNNGVTPAYNFSTTLTTDNTGGFTPATGIAGVLSGSTTPNAFTGGTQTINDLVYSEVGSMRLLATATDYLGTAGADISGQTLDVNPVGRFYPNHFSLSAANIIEACAAGGFTYMDQDELQLQYTLQAERLGGGITLNYFTTGYTTGTVSTVAEDSSDGVDLSGRLSNVGSASWLAGQYTDNVTNAQFDRAASPDGPFENLELGVFVTDQDGAQVESLDMLSNSARSLDTTKVRYGRMLLSNAHGSELLPLTVPAVLQYFDGNNFVLNSDDSCTSLLVTDIDLSNDEQANERDGTITVNGATVTASVQNSPATAGRLDIDLTPPGAGNTGFVDLTPDLSTASGGDIPWLLFDFDGDGTDDDPMSRATFGIFNGRPQQIYMQEVY